MKKLKKSLIAILTLTLAAGIFFGCGKKQETTASNQESTKKVITVGVSQGPYNVLFDQAVKPILEKQGYTVKSVDFQDLLQSEIALKNNEIDFNVAQHEAYTENFNKTQNGRLVGITPIPTVPAGIFSAKYKSISQIKDGAKIAIPSDASNTARAYALLQKAGWIKLKDKVDLLKASASDVVENPHHLQFVEMDSLNIPRAMPDFDFAVITGSIVYNAKIDPKTALLQEDILKHLVLEVVVNKEDKDTEWAKAIVKAYHSDEFKKYMKEHNTNNFWYIPDELK